MHKDAFGNDILPDAKVVYSPLNRRGVPFIKCTVIGETPKKVRIRRDNTNNSPYTAEHLVEPQRLLVQNA